MASAAVLTTTVAQEGPTCSAATRLVLALHSHTKPAACIDPLTEVIPGVFIGSKDSESSLSALLKAGVTHILQCGVELKPSHGGRFVYKQLSVCDKEVEDIVSVFREAFEFIDVARETGKVLVHCAQGVSRSAAVLIGYLMHHTRISFTEALAKAQQARPVVNPNEGFVLQLRKFERLNCNPSLWSGWDEQRLARALKANSVSGRRAVQGLSDVIRRFHVRDLNTDESTVFNDTTVMW